MEPSEHHDRLIDTLLEEFVGGEAPPDLTGRIVARAFTRERRGRRTRAIVTAAAVIAIALFTLLTVRTGYPRPKAFGDCAVVGGGALRRGATVQAGHDYGTLHLGGYCRVDLDPEAVVRIEGGVKAEQVFLVRGRVVCEVDREAGEFAVRTEVGTAAAKGTRFAVQLIEERGGEEMAEKRMLVRVFAGVVAVIGAWGELALAKGEERLVPARRVRAGKARIPKSMVTLSHVDDSAEGKGSLAASGHAAEFECPEGARFVEAVQIFAGRYGYPAPPKEDFHVHVLDGKRQELADVRFPYGMIARGPLRWYTLRTPSIEVTERFTIALAFNPARTKGIHLGLDKNVEASHSLIGLPETGFRRITEPQDWMVRVVLSRKPTGKKGIRRLADRRAPRAGDPFKGCLEIKYDTGKSDGRKSIGGAGPALRFKVSDVAPKAEKAQTIKLHGLRLYASRYGSGYDPADAVVKVAVLDPAGGVRWRGEFPYARFSYKPGWVELVLETPAELGQLGEGGGTLTVALDPQAHRTKGIFFHYNKEPETSHSLVGSVARGFKAAAEREWMIRVYVTVEPVTDF